MAVTPIGEFDTLQGAVFVNSIAKQLQLCYITVIPQSSLDEG